MSSPVVFIPESREGRFFSRALPETEFFFGKKGDFSFLWKQKRAFSDYFTEISQRKDCKNLINIVKYYM